ncbi:hypothetical protein EDB85DRAFT_1991873 [Lactarius pseudohatsudake]|nr:hypothetical protein EDB85DRAFT_1991873 [Lactarius pseudohatsudake]
MSVALVAGWELCVGASVCVRGIAARELTDSDVLPALFRSHFLAHAHYRCAHLFCGPYRSSCGVRTVEIERR